MVVRSVEFKSFIFYDGSNAGELDEFMPDVVLSDDDGTLTLNGHPSGTRTAPPDRWIEFGAFGVINVHTEQDYQDKYISPVLDMPSVLAQELLTGFGSATVPNLVLNQSTTVAVPIAPSQPSGDYTPRAVLVGGAQGLTITNVAVVDADTVNVTVQAGLTYLGGAQVLVVAGT